MSRTSLSTPDKVYYSCFFPDLESTASGNVIYGRSTTMESSPPLFSQDSLDQIEGIVRIDHVLALHHGRHRLAGCPDAQALSVRPRASGSQAEGQSLTGQGMSKEEEGKGEIEEEEEEEEEDSIGRDTGSPKGKLRSDCHRRRHSVAQTNAHAAALLTHPI